MDKKPLIGVSILTVILLVLGSLSTVVGYQSVKLSVNDSPLFQTRTQRAIHQDHHLVTSDYLGKGREINVYVPMKDSEKKFIDRAIAFFKAMDEKSFEEFVRRFISYLHLNDTDYAEADNQEITDLLFKIKSNPESLNNYYLMILEKDKLEHSFEYFCQITFLITMLIATLFLPFIVLYNLYYKMSVFLCSVFELETVKAG
jgi:hypothetical protein